MNRDRRLFATSAIGLLLALPYPGLSLASDLPPAGSGPQATTSTVLVAQNDQSPDESQKKHRGKGGDEEDGEKAPHAAPGHKARQGHQEQGSHGNKEGERQQAEQPKASASAPNASQGEKQHHKQRESERPKAPASSSSQGGQEHNKPRHAEQSNAPASAPNASNASKAGEEHHKQGGEESPKKGGEEHQKQGRNHPTQQSQQSEAKQPSGSQGEETPHERHKHKKGSEANGKTPTPKPENGSASQQPAEQSNQGSSTGQAQRSTSSSKPSASSEEEQHRHGHRNGGAKGEAQSTEGAGHQSEPKGKNSTQPAQNGTAASRQQQNQPAENGKQQEGQASQQQGGKGPQLPESNGMQQSRPSFNKEGHGHNDQEQNGQARNGQAREGRPKNAAPVFDSQKRPFGHGNGDHRGQAGNQPSPNASSQGTAQFGPAPKSDQAAQTEVKHGKIESIDSVKGKRVQRDQLQPFQRRKGADVVKETDNRVIIKLGDQMVVRHHNQRIAHDARDVYYEDLPHDRRRETVLRPDGSKVVTIRNEYGDVIRRSRIMPGGRELVLVYVDDRDLERDRDDHWRDPGADLPPMRLTVPEDDYILDASDIRDPNRYYEFLEQPPVERIPRLYSIGEVKRSARIRDMIPRIDLDTINFDFGSASIGESEVSKLQAVADAIQRILKKNPAETFLIEGHTDAVGTDQSNLILSDERAEAVAAALTKSFDIPPENLTTQGYGEEFLKVNTDGPNRQNRRVTIRRITPLVAPVASNQ